jgi:hypothetical protein
VRIEPAVQGAGDAVADIVETVGNAVGEGLVAVGATLGRVPVVGWLLGGMLRWGGDVVSSAVDLLASGGKAVVDVATGVVGGLVRVVVGIVTLDRRRLRAGLGCTGAGLAGPLVVVLGKALALLHAVVLLQRRERPLSEAEHRLLDSVFEGSVALFNVRVVEGFAGAFSLNRRPFTLGNTIYLKGRDPGAEPHLLVHECVHVWQYQHRGGRYTAEALWAQAVVPDPYSWQEELRRGRTRWVDFNAEAQGRFLEDLHREGRSAAVLAEHPTLAADALATVRGARSWRPSARLRSTRMA